MAKAPDPADIPFGTPSAGGAVNLSAGKPQITPLASRQMMGGGSQMRMEPRSFAPPPPTAAGQGGVGQYMSGIMDLLRSSQG